MISQEQFINDLQAMLKDQEDISLDMDLLDIESWDSFSMVAFVVMAEEKYNVKVDKFSVAEAVLVEDLYDAVLAAKNNGIFWRTAIYVSDNRLF